MTARAELGRAQAKGSCSRILDVVSAMAIDTHRGIRISALQEGLAVNTPRILIINRLVTSRAGGRDAGLRNRRTGHVVSAMAIDAQGSVQIALRKQGVMNAVESFCIIIEVTALARFLVGQREFAEILEGPRRMGVSRDIGVAVRATQFAAMNRAGKSLRFDKERALFAARQYEFQILIAMATETELHVR